MVDGRTIDSVTHPVSLEPGVVISPSRFGLFMDLLMIPKLLRHLFGTQPRARSGWQQPAGWEQFEERKLLSATNSADLEEADQPCQPLLDAVAQGHNTGCGCPICAQMADLAKADPVAAAQNSNVPNGTKHQLSALPTLSSLPGATATIYLDFTGHDEAAWGTYTDVHSPVFDLDGDLTTYSDRELAVIESVWRQVAEDFSPFNLNVTTVAPPSFGDHEAIRVVIGGSSSDWYGSRAGGVAFVGSFYNSGPNTAYVFTRELSGSAKNIALVASHEAGHAFGLQHQSLYDASGTQVSEHNSGNADWAPIMGTAYGATRGTWALGASSSATTIQDDMAVIAGPWNGFGYRTDQYPNDPGQGTLLTGSVLTASSVIETASDADWFTFATTGGNWQINVHAATVAPNLLGFVVLQSSDGTIIDTAILSGSTTLHANLAPGLYRLGVLSNGEYGSAGQYSLTAQATANSGGLIAQSGLAGATPVTTSIPLPANLLNGSPPETGSLRLNQVAQFAARSHLGNIEVPRGILAPEPERQSAGGGSIALRAAPPPPTANSRHTTRQAAPQATVRQAAVTLENPDFEGGDEQPVILDPIIDAGPKIHPAE